MTLHADLARRLLRYDPETGKLYWRERTPDLFASGSSAGSPEVLCRRWNHKMAGTEAFKNKDKYGYLRGVIFGQQYAAHRVAWLIVHGSHADQIDHENGNRADNRLSNIRSVSRAENARNRQHQRNNTSGHIGVTRLAAANRWTAGIKVSGTQIHLGTFRSKSEAIQARKAAERRYGFHAAHGRSPPRDYRNRGSGPAPTRGNPPPV